MKIRAAKSALEVNMNRKANLRAEKNFQVPKDICRSGKTVKLRKWRLGNVLSIDNIPVVKSCAVGMSNLSLSARSTGQLPLQDRATGGEY
jgi:hypothetical protein